MTAQAVALTEDAGHGLIVVVGPSGVGKDTLMTAWLAHRQALGGGAPQRVLRSIDRPNTDGPEQHEAMTSAAWEAVLADGGFALHWRANGHGYGVRHAALAVSPSPVDVWRVLNGSRAAVPAIRQRYPRCQVLAVEAPPAVIAARLAQRGRESPDAIAARLQRQPEVAADFTLVNDGSLPEAVQALDAWWQRLLTRG